MQTNLEKERRSALLKAVSSSWQTTSALVKRAHVEICLSKASQLLSRCAAVGLIELKYKSQGTWLQPLWKKPYAR